MSHDYSPTPNASQNKNELYDELVRALRGLLEGEHDLVANCANMSALLWQFLPDVNWAGFYLYKPDELVLGPFQGKPACVRIAIGKGVCGTAAHRRVTVLVSNVHEFPGHIACDSASNSEIVVPLIKDGTLLGVLDIDSPSLNRFDEVDQIGLERAVQILIRSLR